MGAPHVELRSGVRTKARQVGGWSGNCSGGLFPRPKCNVGFGLIFVLFAIFDQVAFGVVMQHSHYDINLRATHGFSPEFPGIPYPHFPY